MCMVNACYATPTPFCGRIRFPHYRSFIHYSRRRRRWFCQIKLKEALASHGVARGTLVLYSSTFFYYSTVQYSTRSVPSAFCSVLFQSDRYIEIEVLYENEIVCCHSRNITPEDEVQIEFCEENERERGSIVSLLTDEYCTVLYGSILRLLSYRDDEWWVLSSEIS